MATPDPLDHRARARADMKRMVLVIALIGVAMVGGALWYISLFGPLNAVNVTATVGGVFLSVLLGCGLFSLAFYSSKSGHDEASRDATEKSRAAPTYGAGRDLDRR